MSERWGGVHVGFFWAHRYHFDLNGTEGAQTGATRERFYLLHSACVISSKCVWRTDFQTSPDAAYVMVWPEATTLCFLLSVTGTSYFISLYLQCVWGGGGVHIAHSYASILVDVYIMRCFNPCWCVHYALLQPLLMCTLCVASTLVDVYIMRCFNPCWCVRYVLAFVKLWITFSILMCLLSVCSVLWITG